MISACSVGTGCGAKFESGTEGGCVSDADGNTEIGLETGSDGGADFERDKAGSIAGWGSERLVM